MNEFCWGIVGGEAGPTVSVSQDNIYITGTSEDNLSGTAIYRYDPPNNQGEVKNVDNISTGKYTAPRFELTTSGIWTFYAQDTAGNSDTKQTSSITLYRCNYCNQKTVQLHYRCPTHYGTQTCEDSAFRCNIDLGSSACMGHPTYTGNSAGSKTNTGKVSVTCSVCGSKMEVGATYYSRRVGCKPEHYAGSSNHYTIVCSSHNSSGLAINTSYAPANYYCYYEIAKGSCGLWASSNCSNL